MFRQHQDRVREREKISNRSPKTTHNLQKKKNLFYMLPKPEKNSRENVAKFSFRFSASVNTFFHYQVRQSNNSRFYILPTKLFSFYLLLSLLAFWSINSTVINDTGIKWKRERERERWTQIFLIYFIFCLDMRKNEILNFFDIHSVHSFIGSFLGIDC